MKTEIKQEPKQFNPITLTIVIESEDEYNRLKDLFYHNESIPNIIYHQRQQISEWNQLSNLMEIIHSKIKSLKL